MRYLHSLLFVFLLLSPFYGTAKSKYRVGVYLNAEVGKLISYDALPDKSAYKFRSFGPLGASVDILFPIFRQFGLMPGISGSYSTTSTTFNYVYNGTTIINHKYRFSVRSFSIPLYFFFRTRDEKWTFALGGSYYSRSMLKYDAPLKYQKADSFEYLSEAKLLTLRADFGLDMKCFYRFSPKSAVSVFVHHDFTDYPGPVLYNEVGPRLNVASKSFRFADLPNFVTITIGYQYRIGSVKPKPAFDGQE